MSQISDVMDHSTDGASAAPLFFLHIPKTGGVALTAALENSYDLADCHVHIKDADDENFTQSSRPLARFISGHAGPIVTAAVAATHCRMTMLRHPVERFFSYAMHTLRRHREGFTEHAYRSVDDILAALRKGAGEFFQNSRFYATLDMPEAPSWPADADVLDQFAIVGVSRQQRRLLHLVSECCGVFPVVSDWRHNASSNREALHELAGRITPYLSCFDEDMQTYQLAEQMFAERYAEFLERLFDDVVEPRMVPDDMIERRLLERRFDAWRDASPPHDEIHLEMTGPQPGMGWWWRETNELLSYRWLGPELVSTVYLPPVERRDYDLQIDLVAMASQRIAAEVAISIAGQRLEHRFEEVSSDPQDVKYLLRAVVSEDSLPPDGEPLLLTIACPETLPVLARNTIAYSASTTGHDVRPVSLAIARLSLTPRAC